LSDGWSWLLVEFMFDLDLLVMAGFNDGGDRLIELVHDGIGETVEVIQVLFH
jgi:hypothetical protein